MSINLDPTIPAPMTNVAEYGFEGRFVDWADDACYFEYSKAANPIGSGYAPQVPITQFGPETYMDQPTGVVPLDLSADLGIKSGAATSHVKSSVPFLAHASGMSMSARPPKMAMNRSRKNAAVNSRPPSSALPMLEKSPPTGSACTRSAGLVAACAAAGRASDDATMASVITRRRIGTTRRSPARSR